ncbi:MAG: CHRD domain-containing protein [Tildeniella nuda ZEHNDER 1965/U140]|jgi:flagellar hook-basal body complex protein FliE|nr:CHRD domain-containing protein [Tildeniella nuda ZEHNDER 1965/U140]
MELLDQNQQKANELSADSSNLSPNASGLKPSGSQAKGSSILDSNFNEALNQNLSGLDTTPAKAEASRTGTAKGSSDLAIDQNKAEEKMGTCQFAGTPACNCNKTKNGSSEPLDASNPEASKGLKEGAGADPFHVSLGNVDVVRSIDLSKLQKETSFSDDIGAKGDFFIPGAGKNTVLGTGDKDLFDGRGGGFNTITTGGGKDSILLDSSTTNLILDFDTSLDRLLLTKDIDPSNIVIAQGKNTVKDGDNQPLDSVNNTLIIDKSDGHILASLANTKATALQGIEQSERKGFSLVDDNIFNTLNEVKFDQTQEGNGQLTGTPGRDKLVGGNGDDNLLSEAVDTPPPPGGSAGGSTGGDDHDHTGAGASSENHVALDQVDVLRGIDLKNLKKEASFTDDIGVKGDFLIPGAGKNTVIGTGDKDLIDGRGGGFNTITTGGGKDSILLDDKTTNRILDFDPTLDRLLFTQGMDLNNIVIAQGKNPGKGGVNTPLDSVNNTLIIDKSDGHILASLEFTKATALQGIEQSDRKGFSLVDDKIFNTLNEVQFGKTQDGNGQLTGTLGRDKLVGGKGDDFLYVGDDGFKLGTAKGGGGTEFPFKTDSPGTSELTPQLKNGVLSFNGSYKDFDGAPLFSQGEKELDPNTKILNGSNPQALMEGFLKVPVDKEGNAISGTHLHFSPAGDDRGNFADATVVRYFENTPLDAKSGTLSGKFELSPEEQAAFLAGNLYVNIHSNRDLDGDGRAGFATGENRLNLNKNVVQLV